MAKEYKLYEVIKTRYFIPVFTKDILEFFEKCKQDFLTSGEKSTVDICYCKFNPDNYDLVTKYCNDIHFIDSVNGYINDFLDHNELANSNILFAKQNPDVFEEIPVEFDAKGIFDYLQNVDTSKIYTLIPEGKLNGRQADTSILIAMAIGCLFPTTLIDISNQTSAYFLKFQKYWSYTGVVKRSAYNILWQGSVLKVTAIRESSRGEYIFYIPGVGEMTEESLNMNFKVIPFEFGTSANLDDDPELKDIYDQIGADIQRSVKKKKSSKKLTSELTTIQGG